MMSRKLTGNEFYYTYVIYRGDSLYFQSQNVDISHGRVWTQIRQHLKRLNILGLRGVMLRFRSQSGYWEEYRSMVSKIAVGECPIQDRPLMLQNLTREEHVA